MQVDLDALSKKMHVYFLLYLKPFFLWNGVGSCKSCSKCGSVVKWLVKTNIVIIAHEPFSNMDRLEYGLHEEGRVTSLTNIFYSSQISYNNLISIKIMLFFFYVLASGVLYEWYGIVICYSYKHGHQQRI